MHSIWINLLWKEWREHRWKLAAICAVNIMVPLLCSLRDPSMFFGASVATLMFSVPLASMFIGMGVAASEQSRGTIRFLQALPTPMAKPAAAKLLLAAITVIVPVVVAIIVGLVWEGVFLGVPGGVHPVVDQELMGRVWGIENVRLAVVVAGAIANLSFLAWMAATGVNRSDEVRAGAVGMLAIATVWVLVGYVHVKAKSPQSVAPPRWLRVASAAAPGGAAVVHEMYEESPEGWGPAYVPYMVVGALSNGALLAWYVARFGRVATGKRQVARAVRRPATAGWLGPPRRGPVRAMLWKQFRETVPLAAMGAGVIFCLSLIVMQMAGSSYGPGATAAVVHESVNMSLAMWMMIGMFVAVVAGLGVLMDDLRPGLHTFWRSRPIDVDGWFAIKFFTSLLSTIGVLALPPLAISGYLAIAHGQDTEIGQYAPQFGACLLIQIGAFCAAVAAIALVRQPIYAAILAFGALAGVGVVAEWLRSMNYGSEEVLMTVGAGVLAPAAAILAWLAVRYDWGWQG